MRKLEYVALGVILLLTVGRLLWFPIALLLVSGDSMLPTYRTGDLVLGVATYLAGYRVGDVVVWFATYTHGVIHRVINTTGDYVVTKGDNNPLPDPPIPRGFVKYTVVLRVPREVWIPLVLFTIAFYAYWRRRERAGPPGSFEDESYKVATTALTIFILLDVLVLLITPVQWFSYMVEFPAPSVELTGFTVENFTTAIVKYSVSYADLHGVKGCSILVGNSTHHCGDIHVAGSAITIGVPREVFYHAYSYYNTTIASITIEVNATFDKGMVYGKYSYTFNWKPLSVEVTNQSLIVYNPNPITFNLTNVRVVYIDFDSLGRPVVLGEKALGNMSVDPLSSVVIRPEPKGAYCYIQFTYSYRFTNEGYVYESRRIDFR